MKLSERYHETLMECARLTEEADRLRAEVASRSLEWDGLLADLADAVVRLNGAMRELVAHRALLEGTPENLTAVARLAHDAMIAADPAEYEGCSWDTLDDEDHGAWRDDARHYLAGLRALVTSRLSPPVETEAAAFILHGGIGDDDPGGTPEQVAEGFRSLEACIKRIEAIIPSAPPVAPPEALRRRSPEELAALPRLTSGQITAAIAEGQRDKDMADGLCTAMSGCGQTSRHAPSLPRRGAEGVTAVGRSSCRCAFKDCAACIEKYCLCELHTPTGYLRHDEPESSTPPQEKNGGGRG